MKLQEIAYALQVVGDVARASERLFDSLAAARRVNVWPVMFGIGVGVAMGALVFNAAARNRVKAWLSGPDAMRAEAKAAAGLQAQTTARPS